MRRSLALILALAGPAAIADDGPTSREVDQLVEEYFTAEHFRRLEIERLLGPVDELSERDVGKWRKKLEKLARKGPRLDTDGINYFYDEKEKLGKYRTSGKGGNALVVCMHGGGEGSGDLGEAYGNFSSSLGKFKCLAIYPEVLRKTEHGWGHEDTEQFVLELIEAAKRTKGIDPNRVYLTGHSMGGYGTWTIGARYADTFAGLAAFAGAATPLFDPADRTQQTVVGIEDGILPNLHNLPIFFYQSHDDVQVEPWSNLYAGKALPELQQEHGGFVHQFDYVQDRGHAAPAEGYIPGLKWAMSHERDPRPKKILWQPRYVWKRMFYWVWWEHPEVSRLLQVEVSGENEVEITSDAERLEGLALFVDDRLFDLEKPVKVTVNGEELVTEQPTPRLSTMLRTSVRNDEHLLFARRIDLPSWSR